MSDNNQQTVIAISANQHSQSGWSSEGGYGFAKHYFIAPIVADELPHVTPTMPVAFMPVTQNHQKRWVMVAVLSPKPNQNLFVRSDGRWLAGYVPAAFRAYPFKMVKTPKGKRVLGFDQRSERFLEDATETGQRFFDDAGQLTDTTKKVVEFLELYDKNREATEKAVAELADADLIKPWRNNLKNPDSDPDYLKDLFVIDDIALKKMDGQVLARLAQSSALYLAYAQILSQSRISVFNKLQALHDEMLKQAQPFVDEVDLEALFDDDDSFKFD